VNARYRARWSDAVCGGLFELRLPHSTPLARGAPPHVRYQSQSKKTFLGRLVRAELRTAPPLQWGHLRRIFNFIQHAHTQTSMSWIVKHWPIFGPPLGRAMLLVRSVNLYPLPRKALLASLKTNISGHQKWGTVPAASTRCPLDSVTSSERRVT
jgi:hypothetical protein